MALKKISFTAVLILYLPFSLYAKKSYWKTFIQTAFSNSTQVSQIKSSYADAVINKIQFNYSRLPQIQAEIQTSFTRTNGNAINIINQESDSSPAIIIQPFTSLSINQKLPGNGNLSVSAAYGFNYVTKRNVYLQNPYIQLSLSQSLGKGTFGIAGNPENKYIKEQFYYYKALFEKQMSSEFYNIIKAVKNADELIYEEQYYEALLRQYESQKQTAEQKNRNGLQSELETFYAEHQYYETLNKIQEVKYQKENAQKQLILLFPDYSHEELKSHKHELKNEIDNLFMKFTDINYGENIKLNLDSSIYSRILNVYLYQFQLTEINYAPVLYFTSSAQINSSLNYQYSDFYKSFRIMKELENPFNLSFSVGFVKNFELPKAKRLRKSIYEIQKEAIKYELEVNKKTQEKEFLLLLERIKTGTEYFEKLEKEIITEQDFRNKRLELFNRNLITQDEYHKGETLYYLIYKNYINTFWNIICDEISVINLCSIDALLINTFLGENYESVY